MHSLPVIVLVAALASCASDVAARTLTDADISAFAAKPYDKRAKMNHSEVLGTHHGVQVVVDYPCSDICPDYTTQIIHYAAKPGADCDRIGGATVTRMVPVSIAVMRREFCVPKVVANMGARP